MAITTSNRSTLFEKLSDDTSCFHIFCLMFLTIWMIGGLFYAAIVLLFSFYNPVTLTIFWILTGIWVLCLAWVGTVHLIDTHIAAQHRRAYEQRPLPEKLRRKRAAFYIIGPSSFIAMVNRVLDELEQKAPEHYREALEYLPKAEYVNRSGTYTFDGRSDGLFTLDGTGDYGWFRFVFLHETGHDINMVEHNDDSEEAANSYAHMVVAKVA